MKVTICVTKKDIEHGEQGECERCPVARAMQRRLGKLVKVFTGRFTVWRPRKKCWSDTVDFPGRVSKFINRFDANRDNVRPFRFTVSVPR